MAARQQHGFDYEKRVINDLKFDNVSNYISKDDAHYIEKSGIVYPIQIKTIKYGSPIDLGDYKRNKNKTKNFVLIVGFWKDIKSNIVDERILFLPIEWWRSLFVADSTFDEDMYSFLNSISNKESDDIVWKKGCKEFKERWNSYWQKVGPGFEERWGCPCPDRLILPRFKRDHKKQKRIQCAIPNKKFFDYFIKF